MPFRMAIDIGGGFVDLVAIDEQTGQMIWSKTQTTPQDLAEGVKEVFQLSKVDARQVSQLLHGQTLVINAIVQRRGAKVGLITTKGFRDVLAIQRSNRRDIFNLRYKKPRSFVPRHRRLEVDERTLADGKIERDVNEAELLAACERLWREGVDAIAISFINSYVNPTNEKKALAFISRVQKERHPQSRLYLSISSDVTREWKEYERTNTCVLNAYVMPLMEGYLDKLTRAFRQLGMTGTLYMMLSSGGVSSFEYVKKRPIETVESGPVAGVVGATVLAELIGEKNIIALDGGSTTTKASLVEGLHVKFTTDYAIERDEYSPGYPVKVPVVDIVEVGNGGGSVAWLDEVGNLRVGPLSAGAIPGPACYGRGGTQPTLTDAYVTVGFLNSEYFLGGAYRLQPSLAEQSLRTIAEHFKIDPVEAAFAIIRIANDNAAQLLRLISVQRGYDPRDFTLIAHGGSGPMFAAFIAEELEIPKVIVPAIPPGNFSAWGLLMSDLKHNVVQTMVTRLDSAGVEELIRRTYNALENEVMRIYRDEGITKGIVLQRTADLRYYGQEHTIRVPVTGGDITEREVVQVRSTFEQHHEREYGFRLDSPVELVNLRVTGVVSVGKPRMKRWETTTKSVEEAMREERGVYWGGERRITTPIYRRNLLPPEGQLTGPAIVEEPTSTIVIPESFTASIDAFGHLILRRA